MAAPRTALPLPAGRWPVHRGTADSGWTAERMRQSPVKSKHMNVGIIGWRGMVGSVLVQRMREERDFDLIDPVFFSTSQAGVAGPEIGKRTPAVKDAKNLAELTACDVLISCQAATTPRRSTR